MFTFSLRLLSLLLLFTTTTTITATAATQPYQATDHLFLDCGSGSPTTVISGQRWEGDEGSKSVPSTITSTSFSSTPTSPDSSASYVPYTTARIFNTTSFTYIFPVTGGPKFLRLHFYPATYSGLDPNQFFFSVSSNGYSLLTNFSPFLTASFEDKIRSDAGLVGPSVSYFIKEFIIYVKDTQLLNIIFTPSQNSYAFINGIEIVSMPETLYYTSKNLKYVDRISGVNIADNIALETMYRLNMGGTQISGKDDTGMYRSWDQDENYLFPIHQKGLTPYSNITIIYTNETRNYTAPEIAYRTQRSMGTMSKLYNLTWALPVDSGFNYMIRLHFCSIIPQYTKKYQVIFKIFINNKPAEEEVDLFIWTPGSGYPIFRDYGVYVNDPDGRRSKQYLWVVIQPNVQKSVKYGDGYLNGLEAFKLSINGNLSSPNPELSVSHQPPMPESPVKDNKKPPFAAIIGGGVGGLVFLSILVLILLWRRWRAKHYGTEKEKSSKDQNSTESKDEKSVLPSDRCHRFSFAEVNEATNEFNEECVIGIGGFGKVYKGYMNNPTTTVAIKRLNPLSKQGFHEFFTEIGMLSKLRHVHLVSLIGYCDENGEMILVYDYMAHGTLREHLYKSNNPPLTWKTRLNICISAAQGLLYLHTGKNRSIIHRDINSTNILLDENWVAKVSDFGLSKLGPKDQAQDHVSTIVKGSIGYMDPEYYRTRQLTDKSDVYSFGVVLLEVLCARPVMMIGLPKEQVSLAAWGKLCYKKGTFDRIIDLKLTDQIARDCLNNFVEVAISCLNDEGVERPSMEEVVWKLELALLQQETAEKMGGEIVSDLMFLMEGEPTTTDDDMLSGSSAVRIGTSSISSSYEGFKSETVFSEMLKPTVR